MENKEYIVVSGDHIIGYFENESEAIAAADEYNGFVVEL